MQATNQAAQTPVNHTANQTPVNHEVQKTIEKEVRKTAAGAVSIALSVETEEAVQLVEGVSYPIAQTLAVLANALMESEIHLLDKTKEAKDWRENQQLTYDKLGALSKKNKSLQRQINAILTAKPGEFVEVDAR